MAAFSLTECQLHHCALAQSFSDTLSHRQLGPSVLAANRSAWLISALQNPTARMSVSFATPFFGTYFMWPMTNETLHSLGSADEESPAMKLLAITHLALMLPQRTHRSRLLLLIISFPAQGVYRYTWRTSREGSLWIYSSEPLLKPLAVISRPPTVTTSTAGSKTSG